MKGSDALAFEPLQRRLAVHWKHEGSAGRQGKKDIPEDYIEGESRKLRAAISRADAERLPLPVQPVGEAVVGSEHALGFAGASRGEEDIGGAGVLEARAGLIDHGLTSVRRQIVTQREQDTSGCEGRGHIHDHVDAARAGNCHDIAPPGLQARRPSGDPRGQFGVREGVPAVLDRDCVRCSCSPCRDTVNDPNLSGRLQHDGQVGQDRSG